MFLSDSDGDRISRTYYRNKVYKLPSCAFEPPAGKRFAGWIGPDGRRYDDGVLVFNLAPAGGTMTMTAIWE